MEYSSPNVDILDRDSSDMEYRYGIRRLLVRLSSESGVLPTSLFLTGIDCDDKEPFGMGGYADIFRATYKTQPVILKRLRVYLNSRNSEEFTAVSPIGLSFVHTIRLTFL